LKGNRRDLVKRVMVLVVVSAAVLSIVSPALAQKTLEVKGTVLGVHPERHEDGPVIFNVILMGEGPWRAHLLARPEDVKAYATVGGLRRGDKIAASCLAERDRYWIKEVAKEGHVELPEERPDEQTEAREREERVRREIEQRVREEMERRERERRPPPRDDDRD